MDYQHPAHKMSFTDLHRGLEAEVVARNVNAKDGPNGLRMYSYSDRCVYERDWNRFSLMARGLILDMVNRCIAATPFVKFFNYGEWSDQVIPDEPFEVFEKLDGSLIIVYFHAGKWNAATRGSFVSEQAKWAQARLDASNTALLLAGTTYLAEAVYPENRIVISYAESALVLLAGFHDDGVEVPFELVASTAVFLGQGWKVARPFEYGSISELAATLGPLPSNEEGFVLRFESGLRLKFKGEEYRRLHKCIAGVTPLALWEAMKADKSLAAMRHDIPEEFWADFDAISELLMTRLETILRRVESEHTKVRDLSDKELGLNLDTVAADVRAWMFPYRKSNGWPMKPGSKLAASLWDAIRPTANRLDGYSPSSAMSRVQTES